MDMSLFIACEHKVVLTFVCVWDIIKTIILYINQNSKYIVNSEKYF